MEEGEEYQIPPSPSTAESACQRWGGGRVRGGACGSSLKNTFYLSR